MERFSGADELLRCLRGRELEEGGVNLKDTVLVLLDDLPAKRCIRPFFDYVAKLLRSLVVLLAVHAGQGDAGDEAVELTAYIVQLEAAGMARERSSRPWHGGIQDVLRKSVQIRLRRQETERCAAS